MSDFFRERTTALKRQLEIHRVYWRRFYDDKCDHFSRRGTVERSEAEEVLDVTPMETEMLVITTGDHPNHRSRYHVIPSDESWLIQEADTECLHCRTSGPSDDCVECGGTGWLIWKDQAVHLALLEQRSTRTTRSKPEDELQDGRFHDPTIEQFMTDNFRERTAALKKEVEIHAEHCKRFYGTECDWSRWIPSVQKSEAERISNIELLDFEAHVITNGFAPWRLRYRLRPTGQSWLIQEVDTECPFCERQGWKANCIWCGGTIWEHKKLNGGSERSEQSGEEPFP
jgi:hypothetical protein